MSNLLIGRGGMIGQSLAKALDFSEAIGSKEDPSTQIEFENVVCAAPGAEKWRANANPEADLENINDLIRKLSRIKAQRAILISTVDVYSNPGQSTEGSRLGDSGAYGANRLFLDRFIRNHFPSFLILRVSGIVGPSIKKNPLFDLKNGVNLHLNSPASSMQFLPVDSIAHAIEKFWDKKQMTLNLAAEPLKLAELHSHSKHQFTGLHTQNYDVRSRRLQSLTGSAYWASKEESIRAIAAYLNEKSSS